jgi:hypothetical protein
MISPDSPSSGTQFDRLLSEMPRIAEAVNKFASEDNRCVALRVLVRAFGVSDEPPAAEQAAEPILSVVPSLADDSPEDSDQGEAGLGAGAGEPSAARRRARKSAAKKSWPSVTDINFRPEGKPSLREFAKDKAPANLHERNAVAVYYLEEILGIAAIHVGHVLAAYAECEWRYPAKPDNSLQITASTRNWLVTSDMKAIRLTHQGRNLVRFDLPRSSAKKPA